MNWIEKFLTNAKIQSYKEGGVKPYRLFIYLLVTKDIENAAYRLERLKKLKGITIYAQAERNERNGIIPNKTQLIFAQRYIYSGKFRKETWSDYKCRHKIDGKEKSMGKLNISSFAEVTQVQDFGSEQKPMTAPTNNLNLTQAYQSVWGSSYERVESIDLVCLQHYITADGEAQPFKINTDKVKQIVSSAEDIGIITPLIVRKLSDASYQIIAGHHRYEAAKALSLLSVPCVVRSITDDEVFKVVAESNIQREHTLPSEYGKIFSRYMEQRNEIDLTAKEIANKFGVSSKTMYRYLNVAKLTAPLQAYVDNGLIHLSAADVISAFSENNQQNVQQLLDNSVVKKITPAIAKELSELVEAFDGEDMSFQDFESIFETEPKPKYKNKIYNNLSARFHFEHSEKELEELTARLLTEYFENNVNEV